LCFAADVIGRVGAIQPLVLRPIVSPLCNRMRERGMVRLEVRVARIDAHLVREVAAALVDPFTRAETRALLRRRFGPRPTKGLKAMLVAAPIEDRAPAKNAAASAQLAPGARR
jgi:hypothetical protein